MMETYEKVVLFGDSAECVTGTTRHTYWHNRETSLYELVHTATL